MKKIIILFFLFLTSFLIARPIYAIDSSTGLGCSEKENDENPFGPIAGFLCNFINTPGNVAGNTEKVGVRLNTTLGALIGFITIIAALWFIIQIIVAGIQFIGSGGDKHNLESARDKIIWSFVGLLIIVLAWVIAGLIGKILGINILNPGSMLPNLGL